VTGIARAPRAGRVDAVHLRVLARLSLREMLRSGTDATTGAKGHPLQQILLSMGFLGVMFALNAPRFADARSLLAALFAFTSGTIALAILPDTFDVRERKLEILRSKPVTGQTFMAARALTLLAVAAFMALCLGTPGLVAAVLRFSLGASVGLGLLAALVACAFAAVLAWLSCALFLALWLGVERLRLVTQTVLVCVTIGVSLMSLASLPLGVFPTFHTAALGDHPLVRALPSSWFVGLVLPAAGWEPPLALALLAGAALVNLRLDGDRLYARYFENLGRDARAAAPTLSSLLLRQVARLPVAGRILLPRPALATALLILAVGSREETSRLKSLAPRLLQLLFFGVALYERDALIPVSLVAITGFFCLIDGTTAVSQGVNPGAAWVCRGTPVPAGRLVHGMRSAVYAKYFLLAAVLLTVVLLRSHPPLAALVLLAAYHLLASLIVSCLLILRPSLPLSLDQTAAPGLAGAAGTHLLAACAGFAFTIAVSLVTFLRFPGLIAVLVLLVPALAVSIAARVYAVHRVSRLEHAV
jgi:hypothetical protein